MHRRIHGLQLTHSLCQATPETETTSEFRQKRRHATKSFRNRRALQIPFEGDVVLQGSSEGDVMFTSSSESDVVLKVPSEGAISSSTKGNVTLPSSSEGVVTLPSPSDGAVALPCPSKGDVVIPSLSEGTITLQDPSGSAVVLPSPSEDDVAVQGLIEGDALAKVSLKVISQSQVLLRALSRFGSPLKVPLRSKQPQCMCAVLADTNTVMVLKCGSSLKLTLTYPKDSLSFVQWYFNEERFAEYSPSSNYTLQGSQFRGRVKGFHDIVGVTLQDLQLQDSGTFTTVAFGPDDQYPTQKIQVHIQNPITDVRTESQMWEVSMNVCFVEMECAAIGAESVSYLWSGYKTASGAHLQFILSPAKGAVTLNCTATNNISSGSASETLRCSTKTGTSVSVLKLISTLIAASPYLLVTVILSVKCYRAHGLCAVLADTNTVMVIKRGSSLNLTLTYPQNSVSFVHWDFNGKSFAEYSPSSNYTLQGSQFRGRVKGFHDIVGVTLQDLQLQDSGTFTTVSFGPDDQYPTQKIQVHIQSVTIFLWTGIAAGVTLILIIAVIFALICYRKSHKGVNF
ncbi:T-lymphocyte surface antigen Ly-9-like [Silurus meridionalis]|nr:T-lymphocyte surface antigen Ly-9-like [Silurus meridionalis]